MSFLSRSATKHGTRITFQELIAPISINANAVYNSIAVQKIRMIREWFMHMMRKILLWFVCVECVTCNKHKTSVQCAVFADDMKSNGNLLNRNRHWQKAKCFNLRIFSIRISKAIFFVFKHSNNYVICFAVERFENWMNIYLVLRIQRTNENGIYLNGIDLKWRSIWFVEFGVHSFERSDILSVHNLST